MNTESPEAAVPKPTTERAIQVVASMFGIGRGRVWEVAGKLQGENMWPLGARGREKPRWPDARHFANLLIGLATTESDQTGIVAGRVKVFGLLEQVKGERPGLKLGDAFAEMINLAAQNGRFRNQLIVHQGYVAMLAPTVRPGAEIWAGPATGCYSAENFEPSSVASLMHVRSFAVDNIPHIRPASIIEIADLLAEFNTATAALESKTSSKKKDMR